MANANPVAMGLISTSFSIAHPTWGTLGVKKNWSLVRMYGINCIKKYEVLTMSTTQTFIQPIVVTALNHAFLPLGQRSGKRVLAASMFLCSMCFTAFYFAKVFLRLRPL